METADLEGTLELKDPDHPQAIQAANATARLLVELHETRQRKEDEQIGTTDEKSGGDADA